ncbi:hypothetical protein ACJVC5_03395 [Peredibacter sp. HCB2-198]|uniref:hypothetical protein n=1 Tax=Peredibacter sp. HCB2-198 TaxID=3383025 RepID=UPI0038B5C6C2
MKFLLALALLVTTNAFAIDLCSFEQTWELDEALESMNVRPLKVSDNHKSFTNVEKQLIYTTVIQQDWRAGVSMKEALEIFGDYYDGKLGSNSGEIKYFNVKGQKFAIVHYWPGDNEYGAIFKHINNQFHLIASIGDGEISCK